MTWLLSPPASQGDGKKFLGHSRLGCAVRFSLCLSVLVLWAACAVAAECSVDSGTPAFKRGEMLSKQALDTASPPKRAALREEAVACFKKVVEENPANDKAWSGWGEVPFAMSEEAEGDPEQAAKFFAESAAIYTKGLEHNPDSNFLWYMWGSNLALRAYELPPEQKQAMREDACNKFAEAVRTMPDDVYSWRMWAKLYWRMADEPEQAKNRATLLQKSYDKFIKAYSLTPEKSAFALAQISAELGKKDESKRFLQQADKQGEIDLSGPELLALPEFDKVKATPWFKAIVKKYTN